MNRKLLFALFLILLPGIQLSAQSKKGSIFSDSLVKPRMRLIIDNDFGGDPDGLFELVHHLLSPSVDIRGIIGSHLRPGDFWDTSKQTATHAKNKVEEVLRIMNLDKTYAALQGSNFPLQDTLTARPSEAAEAIVKEAMRDDTKLPLYIVCGAGLTDIASAWLMKPEIARRLTLIWIGGPEYSEMAVPPPGNNSMEYNLAIDLKAAQVIFNKSSIPIWQVPRNVYRQVIMPYSTMLVRVKSQGAIGEYLTNAIEAIMKTALKYNFNVGEVYITGDSPLVLLTALQSTFDPDPSSSFYLTRPSPLVNNRGLYEVNHSGRNIRVYYQLDVQLLFEDFYSKLVLFNQHQ